MSVTFYAYFEPIILVGWLNFVGTLYKKVGLFYFYPSF
jgi:hypothetical protein